MRALQGAALVQKADHRLDETFAWVELSVAGFVDVAPGALPDDRAGRGTGSGDGDGWLRS
jgi:hypothetical protein